MDITVKDFLSKAWSKTDPVAIRNIETEKQEPQYMAVMTAREGWGDWIVDMFSMGKDVFGHSKCLHLWVYQAEKNPDFLFRRFDHGGDLAAFQ